VLSTSSGNRRRTHECAEAMHTLSHRGGLSRCNSLRQRCKLDDRERISATGKAGVNAIEIALF